MKKIKFLFEKLGPYDGFYDNTYYLRKPNIFVTPETLESIKKDFCKSNPKNISSEIFEELSNLKISWDRLACLIGFNIYLIQGYHIVEHYNNSEVELENAKEVLLDGHYVDILLEKPAEFGDLNFLKEYNFEKKYHGFFDKIDKAEEFIKTNLEMSERNSSWAGNTDEDLLRGDTLKRYYKYKEYIIGDLGKSISEIPSEIYDLSPEEIKKWCEQVLLEAKNIEPDVYWFLDSIPLELRIYKNLNKYCSEKKEDIEIIRNE
jgi:hypothetical protein